MLTHMEGHLLCLHIILGQSGYRKKNIYILQYGKCINYRTFESITFCFWRWKQSMKETKPDIIKYATRKCAYLDVNSQFMCVMNLDPNARLKIICFSIFYSQRWNSNREKCICLSVSLTHAYPKLAPYRPAGQLLSPSLLFSVFLNTCFTCTVQIYAFLSVKQQPWYCEVYKYR